MSDYISHPYLSSDERLAFEAWTEVISKRSKRWPQTEAARMFKGLGLENKEFPVRVPLQRAFARGEIDGTLDVLQSVVDGTVYVGGFGEVSRQRLAGFLIDWYKMGLKGDTS